MKPEYSEEDRKLAVKLYAEGEKIAVIARQIGCGQQTVSAWARKEGLTRRPGRVVTPIYSDEDRKKAVEMYLQGVPNKLIARQIGCGSLTIRRWAAHEGAPARKQGPTPEKKHLILTLYGRGVKMKDIAEQAGYSVENINILLSQWGVERNRGHKGISQPKPFRSSEETVRKALFLYQDGYSLKQVSSLVGVPRNTVQHWLKKRGVQTRNQHEAQRMRKIRKI